MHDGRGKNLQAYLWKYNRPEGPVVFDFRLERERKGSKRFLGNFEGILQSDGYGGYSARLLLNSNCGSRPLEKEKTLILPRDYLSAILPGLADFPAKRVAEHLHGCKPVTDLRFFIPGHYCPIVSTRGSSDGYISEIPSKPIGEAGPGGSSR
jgi:hypothetical protein